MSDKDEAIEGILKQVLVNHKDEEVTGCVVLVFTGAQVSIYNSNVKMEIVDQIADLISVKPNGGG